jgi:hypothetical protein
MDVTRNYIDVIADKIRSCVAREDLPDEDTVGLFRSYAVLLLAKGSSVTVGDVHNAWAAWMVERDPAHPSLVPFSELSGDVAAADEPFVAAIHEAARHVAL